MSRGGQDRQDRRARWRTKVLASGFLREVWAADDETAALRWKLSRRRQLVKQRTREKNQVHPVLIRNLKGRPPMSDLLGVRGRAWLADQELPGPEREMVQACLRHLDSLDQEITAPDRAIAERVLASEEMLRLLQLPGLARRRRVEPVEEGTAAIWGAPRRGGDPPTRCGMVRSPTGYQTRRVDVAATDAVYGWSRWGSPSRSNRKERDVLSSS
jgi:hypothetical protein